MINIPTLHTQRCKLIPFTEEDKSWLFQLFNDPDVLYYMEGMKLFSTNIGETELFIRNMNRQNNEGNAFLWAIQNESSLIGFVAIYDVLTVPNLFYAVCKGYRNQGYATECVYTVTHFFQDQYNTSLTTSVKEDNIASLSVLKKCGFAFCAKKQLYIKKNQ